MNNNWCEMPDGTTDAFIDRGRIEWRKLENEEWFAYGRKGWERIVGRPEMYHPQPEGEKK